MLVVVLVVVVVVVAVVCVICVIYYLYIYTAVAALDLGAGDWRLDLLRVRFFEGLE